MVDTQACADKTIGNFIKDLGAPYWPNWSGLIPGDTTHGWNASKADWRGQADSIIDAFETCVGVKIVCPKREIDDLRSETLSVFSDYLVEKASLSVATLHLKLAKANLSRVKLLIKTFTP